MTKIISVLNAAVWGAPALILIVAVGLFFTLRTGAVQLRLLPHAMSEFVKKLFGGKGNSSFRSLCTALGATVGTGNLVGVAGAICLGGPGSIFWMWVCGILGMVTKFAEATLAVRYRVRDGETFRGGPMYMITEGLDRRFRPLAAAYCVFGIAASFGVGNGVQINAVMTGIRGIAAQQGIPLSFGKELLLALGLSLLVGMLLFGGAKGIAAASELLVPAAAAGYILMCLGVLFLRPDRLGDAFSRILMGAFSPEAVTGGVLGSSFRGMRIGCSRGVFTNEAGMGTAAIAHGAAQVPHPVCQGLMGIMEVFLDTIVICTLTALVILVSGVTVPYGVDAGGELAAAAFCCVFGPAARYLLTFMLMLFAVATVLGWGFYGARCAEFLFGPGSWKYFAGAQTLTVLLSALGDGSQLWQLSELLNGLMLIPNLIAVSALSGEVIRLTKEYEKNRHSMAGGGTYANFHQCKPL